MIDRRKFLGSLLGAAAYRVLSSLTALAGTTKPQLRTVVLSDLNHSYGTIGYEAPVQAAIRRVIELKPDLVLCTGDMIAGQRTAPKLNRKRLEAMWQAFHKTVTQPLADAGIPFAPSPGNHDASASAGFKLERDIYREQWERNRPALPLLDGGNYPFYYAFTKNKVLFTSLDVTVSSPLSSTQMQWLNRVLDEVGRENAARIVYGHLPLYPLTVGRERGFLRDPDLEQLLTSQSVSVYLSGHQHGFYPFYHNNQYYIGQAALGSGPRRLIGDTKRSPRALTMIDISANGTLAVTAYTGSTFNQVLQRSTLPPEISANNSTIVRDDLIK